MLQAKQPQDPAQPAYWFDRSRNTLVGLVMGLDLIRNGERYYLLELNTNPALKPERRALFETDLDPLLVALVEQAKAHGFRRLVLMKRAGWPEQAMDEFALAATRYRIEVVPASGVRNAEDWLPELPRAPEPGTAYHLFSSWRPSAHSVDFLHNKWSFANWTRAIIDREPGRFSKLAYVPTYREPIIAAETTDERWPNLVLKLASSDRGAHVAMGRFSDASAALDAFGINQRDPQSTPAIFKLPLSQRIAASISPQRENIFQPFIPPDTVGDRPRVIRLNVFLSPLYSLYLSSHEKISSTPLPERHPQGLTRDYAPYALNFARSADYALPTPDEQDELAQVAAQFGEMVRMAMEERFEIGFS